MLKLLVLIGVIYAVYYFLFKKKPIAGGSKNGFSSNKLEDNDMVECATCGVYIAVKEAILSNGKYYCSKECLEKTR